MKSEENICAHCGCVIDDDVYECEGDTLCEDCADELTGICDDCSDRYYLEHLNYSERYDVHVCDNCLSDGYTYTRCARCGEIVRGENWRDVYVSEDEAQTWCDDCTDYHTFYCDSCDRYFDDESVGHGESDYYDCICEYCARDAMDTQSASDISDWCAPSGVMNYGYKPMIRPCVTSDELEERPDGVERSQYWRDLVLLGFELEMEDHAADRDLPRNRLDEDADMLNSEIGYTYCKEDGSLYRGIELVSHPATLQYHMAHKDTFERVFDEMAARGYTSHDNGHCGMHVHISRDALLKKNPYAIHNLLLIVDNRWDDLVHFSRRTAYQLDRWAARYSTKHDDPRETAEKARGCGRYMAINLENSHTVEIRMFRGTLNVETFCATLQLVQRLVDLSIQIKDPDFARSVTWSQIIDCEYPELNAYCARRFASMAQAA